VNRTTYTRSGLDSRQTLALTAPLMAVAMAGCVAVNINVADDGSESTTVVGAYVTVGVGVGGSGGAGSGGAGSGGGGGASPEETCPGLTVPVAVGATVTIDGDTSLGHDDWKTFCADPNAASSARDLVYHLALEGPCTLSLEVVAATALEAGISLRETCELETGDYACLDVSTQGTSFAFATSAMDYYVVVDGVHQTSGAFSLQVTCGAPACGDGTVNAGEQCDGGPGVQPLDGCGDPGTPQACTLQGAPVANTCADIAVTHPIALGQTLFLPDGLPLYDTLRATNEYESPTCSFVGASGPDQVMRIVPEADGQLSVTIGQDHQGIDFCAPPYDMPTCWNHVIWIRETDCEGGAELACAWSDAGVDNAVNTVTVPVLANRAYYVFVEGDLEDPSPGHNGPYVLRAVLE